MISLILILCVATVSLFPFADANKTVRQSSGTFPRFTEETCNSLPTLVCNLQPTSNWTTSGAVYFTPVYRPVSTTFSSCFTRIRAVISGLPNARHGFHIHTYGDLSSPEDGSSTGGHFSNPAGDEDLVHAWPNSPVRHWGDFGNLEVAGNGVATYDRVDRIIRLGGVVGRAITIHEGEDQGVAEQPSGAAGARIAFCVIGYSNPDVLAG